MKKNKSTGINCLFFSACFIVIIFSSMLLYFEYTEMFAYERSEKAGMMTYKEKITQRKPQSEVIWENITKGSLIFTGDTVRTGEYSSAVVSLSDGTKITMSDNSMIRFFLAKDELNIGFLNGAISVKRTGTGKSGRRGMNIKIRDNYIPVSNSNIQIFESDKNVNVTLSGGDGIILSEKEYPVKDNENIVMNSSGVIKSSAVVPKLLLPDYDKFFITYSGSKEIGFSWEPESKKNILEISRDRNFHNITVKRKSAGSSASVKLSPGIYYWRVKSFNRAKKTDISNIWRFTIIKDKPVIPYNPFNGRKFTYVNKPPMIDFRWEYNPLSLKYVLEISGDNKFQNIIKSIQTGETYISADLPGAGTYYWRIITKAGFEEDESPDYIIYKFHVIKTENFESIALLKPRDKSIIVGNPASKKLIFSCGEYNEIDYYKLIISNRENPGMPEYDAISKNNFMIPDKVLPEGEYLWRVEGIYKDIGVVSKSGTRSFRIISAGSLRIISPGNSSISVASEDLRTAKILFSWDSGVPEAAYLIRLFSDEKMNNLLREETVNRSSITIDKLQPGRYYWNICLLDNYKNEIIVSDNYNFTVKEPLPAPLVSGPVNNSVIDILKKNNIEFSWSPAEEADLFKISIFRIENNKETMLWEKETKDTDIMIDNIREYGKGDYAWTLQAFETDAGNKIVRKSRILKNHFILTRRLLEKPEIEKLEIR